MKDSSGSEGRTWKTGLFPNRQRSLFAQFDISCGILANNWLKQLIKSSEANNLSENVDSSFSLKDVLEDFPFAIKKAIQF